MADTVYTSDALFMGKDEGVRTTYTHLLEALHALEPFQEEPKKPLFIYCTLSALLACIPARVISI
ncbi:MAG: hypothetical protein NVSMB49_06800 [Ktedonobacteraceae bacterium]